MGSKRLTNRRAFLKGKSAVQAIADAADALAGEPSPLPEPSSLSAPDSEGYLVRYCRRAMACQFEVLVNAGQYEHDGAAALAALDLVDELESQLSIYRESSEVSVINRTAADESVRVEPRLFALLERAIELSTRSHGAFDMTTGPLARLWGFVNRSGAMPDDTSLTAALEQVGSRHVQLDPKQATIHFERPGIEINLGGIGKGYALDRGAELFAAAGIDDVLLHGGNSSVLARGTAVAPDQREGWTIGLRDPYHPDRRIGQIHLRDRALATSGSGTQFFLHQGRRFGHIIDPRSGWPAEGVLSATVLAPSAADADALSTALYVLGPVRAEEFCAANSEIGCILLSPGARHAAVEIHTWGLEDGEFESV
jgi:thiamine biosynthesis lipoprotein